MMALSAIAMVGAICAFGIGGTPDGSSAYEMHPNEAAWIADAVTQQLTDTYPAAATELLLVGPRVCPEKSDFHPVLDQRLRKVGFAIASHRASSPAAQTVRYHVTKSNPSQTVIQLEVNGQMTTRLLNRDLTGALRPSGPIAVRH